VIVNQFLRFGKAEFAIDAGEDAGALRNAVLIDPANH
jgi:hypothetical protein